MRLVSRALFLLLVLMSSVIVPSIQASATDDRTLPRKLAVSKSSAPESIVLNKTVPASHTQRARLKGVGAKVVILEEASRLDEAVFTEVIVPLLNVRDTALLAISTPLDENNFYSTLLSMKDPLTDGPMFKVLEIKLICEACAKKGVKDVCPHRRELIPPWKNDHRRELMTKALFEGQPRMYMQEQLGIPSGSDARCFDTASIDAFAATSVELDHEPRHVFVGIDTCGGGNNFMALILAVDTAPVTSDLQLETEMASHFDRLRQRIPRSTILVSIIEANYGGWVQASRIAHLLQLHGPVVHVSCDKTRENKRPGIYTTWEIKERMRHELQRLLRERRICLSADIVTSRPGDVTEMTKQLRRCEYIYKPVSSASVQERKRMISGKVNGQNDDVAIALMLLAYWSAHYINTNGRCSADI
ncbi:hypothetical protein CYMTET_44331 [Cymbomonas tetramitiformis]|uniref:Terminase large subunit gp17-like C-terminal domain-containing protein n=1 Tax=Cymbomonas tetramitiformis TaxID=36881 RepID=A0AAE0C229_9CHLO|nr:hypothetical protein CYMTET_44331 [Cymbomonas tetramitiformis]